MDLFSAYGDNLLPYDGEVNYYGRLLTNPDDHLTSLLVKIPWKNDQVFVNGELRSTKRKVAWYGDHTYSYTYSGVTRQALSWTTELLELKQLVENKLAYRFNSCLLNLYNDGSEAMAWHSDDEASLGKNTTIASLTLGAERKFMFKHKTSRVTTSVLLEQGSLLVMKGATQSHWLHSLPPSTKTLRPRINLTFRTIIE
ncbi:alpha-ketoglutarate-dependent dioxygenase AlkB [Mucilaginibacter sp. cycad4]|uniref:alpha-ketoglutarate-dependent dioxygenase AlkB family protein n=1 Tax=Mucilaginibacter sp. cycad4 TaxID=3342096 RepID=UPI002AABB60F|nr:alpha-ketoglutarate-dependent dioxygenase AlkB [Mucilaginibacter gossypii]WPV02121.1 alpha-ketoglutarate-dependent dioxygenase AlkB [Mucilaginibacter gossypii]